MRERKQADLDTLIQGAIDGHVRLKYLDESGFDCWSPPSYGWSRIGVQHRQEQTKRHGRRVNIVGILEPGESFVYGLVVGKMTSERYIRLMDWQATEAQRELERSGAITVVVEDNAPIHTSGAVKERIAGWQEQGLYIFALPKYCSEMNDIECEWRRIKSDEIRGAMFEDEVDLALEVIRGVQARGEKTGYKVKRFDFKAKRLIR